MARIHGKSGKLLLATGATTPVLLTNVTDWTLGYNTDAIETTSMGDANKTYVTGLPDLQGTFSAWYDIDSGTIIDAALSASAGTATLMYIYPDLNQANYYAYGSAYVDASLQGGVNAAVQVRANFRAAGNWNVDRLTK